MDLKVNVILLKIQSSLFISILLVSFLLNSKTIFAQVDEAVYEFGFPFKEGIYASFEEFRSNNPSISVRFEKRNNQLYVWDDSIQEMILIDPNKVWGYSQSGNINIAFENSFWRLINIGQLSQFSAVILRTVQSVDAFGFPIQSQSRSFAQFFIDMQEGAIYDLTPQNVLPYLENTPEIRTKFKNIKRMKAKNLLLVIKAYNELYPIYFPINE